MTASEQLPDPSFRDLVERCHEAGWTDGLPVIPPDADLVEEMLGGRSPEEIVVVLDPGRGVATMEKIAANTVMAGCRPDAFPVVLAALRAIADERFGAEGLLTSLHSSSPMLVVHGGYADRIGMNGDTGALGAGNRANATVGRAVQLSLRNLAGARPDRLGPKTLGHPGGYSYCFAENRALSPWDPLHVDRGSDPATSAVTVYGADAPVCIADMGRTDPELILRTIVESIAIPGTYNAFYRRELWLIMTPEHAVTIADAGWSKRDVQNWIHRQAVLPADRLRDRGLYGFIDAAVRPRWIEDAAADQPVALTKTPDSVVIVVAGGASGGYTAVVFGVGQSITKQIDE